MMQKGSTVWLPSETKEELDKLKIIPEEPYHKVIARLIVNYQSVSVKKKEAEK